MDRARIMDGMKVALAAQHRTHAIGRPALDLAAELAEELDEMHQGVAVIGFGNVKPTFLRGDPAHGVVADGVAYIVEAGLRQAPTDPWSAPDRRER